jgi:hypothetical protein
MLTRGLPAALFPAGPTRMRTQPLVITLTGYATLVALRCPCKRTLSCHLPHYFLSIGLAAMMVLWENYF